MHVMDVKGAPVHVDSLVEGFAGLTERAYRARVTWVSPWGWIVAYSADDDGQYVFYEGRYLVRGEPRPSAQRGNVPEKLRR